MVTKGAHIPYIQCNLEYELDVLLAVLRFDIFSSRCLVRVLDSGVWPRVLHTQDQISCSRKVLPGIFAELDAVGACLFLLRSKRHSVLLPP